jgi:hypothetical protein
MGINFILRFFWVMAISPTIVQEIGGSEIVLAMIGAAEILRRNIWNFLRVEKEHLRNCGSFKATADIVMPFENIAVPKEYQALLYANELKKVMTSSADEDNLISRDMRKKNFYNKDQPTVSDLSPTKIKLQTMRSGSREINDPDKVIEEVKRFKKELLEFADKFKILKTGKESFFFKTEGFGKFIHQQQQA